MEYQKPIVNIAGDLFRVEYALDCLQLLADPTKQLPFAQMEYTAKDYWRRFLYNTQSKELYVRPEALQRLPPAVVYAELQSKRVLDAVAHLREQGWEDHKMNPAHFEQNAANWTARLLPRVALMHDEFFIDVRRLAFIDTINPRNLISMDDIQVMPNNKLSVDYDLATRSINDPEIEDYQKDTTCIIFLEPLEKLDPEGFALLKTLPEAAVGAVRTTNQKPRTQVPPQKPAKGRRQ